MKNKNKTTKFPVARIKRIMQKDEEVGKVAQATPIVISKAVELFLALVIDEASKVTTERGSKRVEAYHLKHAVETVEMLDFLKEIVEGVPDPSAGGTIPLEAEPSDAPRKKRGKGKKPEGAAPAGTRKRRRKGAQAQEEQEREDEEEEDGEGGGAQQGVVPAGRATMKTTTIGKVGRVVCRRRCAL
ncbi:histone-fold-containing protein [Amylocystis lapponica]|nr:histone-fold-containing protein [Amylocystis lapponica]